MFPDADDLFSEELAVLVMSVTITQTKLRNLLPRLITRIAAECEPKTKSMPKYCMIKRAACATIRSFGGGVKRQRLVKGVLVGTALGCLG
jgi:hypothetical protein